MRSILIIIIIILRFLIEMLRILLKIWPFLLVLAAYLLYLRVKKRKKDYIEGEFAVLEEGATPFSLKNPVFLAVLYVALLVLIVCLVVLGVS